MASRYPPSELSSNTFIFAEQMIRFTFESLIRASAERRDQLLVQLNDMRLDYLNREETRNKQVSDVQKLISQLMEAHIKQNPIVELKEDQIKNLVEEQKKYQTPTPVPFPGINTEGLESLLEQLRGFGAVEEVGGPYKQKGDPVRRLGKMGNKRGEFSLPTGIALHRDESIYIADTWNSRIQIFSTVGKSLTEFGKEQLVRPYSIAVNDEWVFVSDYILNAVIKFERTSNNFAGHSSYGELEYPCGLSVDTNGEVLVADSVNNRVAVLSSELKFIRNLGNEKFKSPRDVKINKYNIFVADKNETSSIHIFTKSGDLVTSIIRSYKGTGDIHFCLDSFNNIIVSESSAKSIQIFSMNGQFIHKIVCMSYPKGVVVYNSNILCVCNDGILYIY